MKNLQQLARRRRVAELYLQHHTIEDIAEQLKLKPATVRRDLKAAMDDWRASTPDIVAQARARDVRNLELLQRTFMEAWQRSTTDRVVVKREQQTVTNPDGSTTTMGPAKLVQTREAQVGNPAYLQGAMDCIRERNKLLGTYVDPLGDPLNPGNDNPMNGRGTGTLVIRVPNGGAVEARVTGPQPEDE